MPPWRRKIVTASANCAGFVLLMLGYRVRVKGWENVAKAKQLGAVCSATPALCTLYKLICHAALRDGKRKLTCCLVVRSASSITVAGWMPY